MLGHKSIRMTHHYAKVIEKTFVREMEELAGKLTIRQSENIRGVIIQSNNSQIEILLTISILTSNNRFQGLLQSNNSQIKNRSDYL